MELNAASTSFKKRLDICEVVLGNMQSQMDGAKASILLGGDPGIGKTSFVEMFATLIGMNLVIIEAPHITEEHIINIPFIIYDPKSETHSNGVTSVEAEYEQSDFTIKLSDSHLYTKLTSIHKLSDEEYLKNIYNSTEDIIKIFESLKGNETTVPPIIQEVREKFKVILFLDEYFRQTSTKIRNMLRGILDGRIGSHKLPKDVYVMYASNLKDEGNSIEGRTMHGDFDEVDFGEYAASKDEWFAYLISKFKKDEKGVKLDMKIIEKFYEILGEEELNFEDMNKEVRTSPRRWEQLLLYINAALPASSYNEAKALLSNVKVNFKNYLSGEKSELAGKVEDAVVELIKETSDIDINAEEENTAEEWQDTLEHQIRMKMKLGKNRKYIPIISGMPGIGKTTFIYEKVTHDLDLRYIYINCSNLSPEDVTGMPLPSSDGKGDKKISTAFSEPSLYKTIVDDMKKADEDHIAFLRHKYKEDAEDHIKEYEKKPFKYLIFFDELNRNSHKVFNGIRKLLLEKTFGGGYDIPEGTVMVGAINPKDNGAETLTGHMRDVVDVIDASADFNKTLAYIKKREFKGLSFPKAKDIVFDIFEKFVNRFSLAEPDKDNGITMKQRKFYLNTGDVPTYISQREYTDMYTNAVRALSIKYTRLVTDNSDKIDFSDEAQVKELDEQLRLAVFTAFKNKLNSVFAKQTESPGFLDNLKGWFLHSDDFGFGDELYFKKADTVSLGDILSKYVSDESGKIDYNKHLFDDIDFISFIENNDPQQMREQLTNFFKEQIKSAIEADEKVLKKKHPLKQPNEDGSEVLHAVEEEVSEFEYIIREILHAVKINKGNKISGEYKEVIKMGMSNAIKRLISGEDFVHDDDGPYYEVNSKMGKLIRTILKNAATAS